MPYLVLDPSIAAAAPVVTAGNPLTSTGETLLSLRNELRLMLGNRGDIPQTRYDLWLNQAYIDVATSLDIDVLRSSYGFTTVADQPFYMLPAAVFSTRGASLINTVLYPETGGKPLEKSNLDEFRAAKYVRDVPRSYFREGKMLVLWPVPDQAYTIAVDYVVRPSYMVNPTDSPILPLEFHEVILQAARQKGFAALLEFDKSVVANNDFVDLVRRKEDSGASEDNGRVIGSSVPHRRRSIFRQNTPRELGD